MVEQIGDFRGAAYQLRLGQLRDAQLITAVCMICRHEGPFDLQAQLADEIRGGVHQFVKVIEERLRCRGCRVRGMCKLRVVWSS